MSPARLERKKDPRDLKRARLSRVTASCKGQPDSGWDQTVSNAVIVLTVLVASCLLTGCRTSRLLPPADFSEPGWHVQTGQTVWRSKKGSPEIAGEILVASRTEGRVFLQFTKTPLPFVIAQATADAWQIEFTVENKSYFGPGAPPSRLGWLQLARCLAALPPAVRWHWQNVPDGHWRLENTATGEMFEGFLSP